METYIKRITGALNVALLVIAVIAINGSNNLDGQAILFAILVILTPAFTLFTLFAPRK